ncbi:MAG: hypothetical protein JW814_09025 [Candidatus Krumholzibacteriota bacterium]|nr:hypothetical protein [Candidatus Krumholzibacteriota bacterium]
MEMNQIAGVKRIYLFVAILLVVLVVNGGTGSAGSVSAEDPEKVEVGLIVTSVLDNDFEPGKAVLFCATFQIAWDRMATEIVGEKIVLDRQIEMADLLNSVTGESFGLNERDFLVMTGYGADDIVGKSNRELRVRFGGNAPIIESRYNDDDGILAYAFLSKMLKFRVPFQEYERPMKFSGSAGSMEVHAFGISPGAQGGSADLRSQVEILEYSPKGEMIIRLETDDPEEELVLASVEPEESLIKTYEKIARKVSAASPELIGEKDILLVPIVDFSTECSFKPLLGRYLRNEGFREYFIAEARQDVRFRLDSSGVQLESEGVFFLKKGGGEGRSIIFSRPFLLYLKRKGAELPYLAVWVDGAEVMAAAAK